MRFLGRAPLVGAYLCPQGAFAIECKRTGAGIEVARTFDEPAVVESALEAADQLIRMLRLAGIQRADVAVTLRGFGVVHHVLQMPPAKDAVLEPIIDREVRRLDPQLGESTVSWIPLPQLDTAGADGAEGADVPPQRSLLAAAAPQETIRVIDGRLRDAGYRLLHLTALPASMQRLLEEFEDDQSTVAVAAALPDGAFLGFALNGGIRLVIEPPMAVADHEASALAEEIELGAIFVRQQFNAAQIDRVALVGSKDSLAQVGPMLAERLHVPVNYLGTPELSPASFAALGAILDNQAVKPLSLGGASRDRSESGPRSTLDQVSVAALFVLALLGGWTVLETARTMRADRSLQLARRQVEQESFGLAPIRATADQRRLVRDALAAMQTVASDRVALQEALAGVAESVRPPIQIDSMSLARVETGWRAVLVGNVSAATSARAVQALHDAYRELPQRLSVDSLRLEELSYPEAAATDLGSLVRFQLSFGIPVARRD